jgi:hypothetical protein
MFAGATTAGNAPPLFVAITDHAASVDGGLSRGVAFGDADGDGDADLLVANTINYPEFLYRNDHDRFVQVMETAPSLAGGFTEGVNWIDFDNDGDLDIFAARLGRRRRRRLARCLRRQPKRKRRRNLSQPEWPIFRAHREQRCQRHRRRRPQLRIRGL